MNLEGKIALVTGGARRVGKAISLALAFQGVTVLIHHRHPSAEADQTVEEIKRIQQHSNRYMADLSKTDEIRAMFDKIGSEYGGIDILVNNAAIFYPTPLHSITEKEWDDLMNTNLRGAFFASKFAVPLMNKRGGGKIINIADVSAENPWPNFPAYSISKSGIITMTKVLAKALAPKILVNAVAPGPVLFPDDFTETDMQKSIDKTLLKRAGQPTDVSAAVLYLLQADYVTGEVLAVDGGRQLV